MSAHDIALALERLEADGYVVLEGLVDDGTVSELRARVEGILRDEREHPFDPGESPGTAHDDEAATHFARIWELSEDEAQRLARRNRHKQAQELDTPWPVSPADVCISFIHIPTFFDDGRSQRIFNLINKDPAFAPLVEHPTVLAMMDVALGRDLIALDISVNHVGAAHRRAADGTSTHRSPRSPSRCPTSPCRSSRRGCLTTSPRTTAPPTSSAAAT